MGNSGGNEVSIKALPDSAAVKIRRSRLNAVDLFAIFNLALFASLASSIYWQRFLEFRSRANLPEFLVYAGVLMAGIAFAWIKLRRLPFSVGVLAAFQVGLLLHFAGGLYYPGGMRLYDMPLGLNFFDYAMRFDKVVHFVNAFIGCIVVLEVFRVLGYRMPKAFMLFVVLSVLGVGAIIEIIEYVVTKTIPHNGVGDYDNNMTDLLGNLVGCLTFVSVWAMRPLRRWFPLPGREP